MNKKAKTIAAVAGFALLLALAAGGYRFLSAKVKPQQPAAPSPQAAALSAPDFTVQDAAGRAVSLSAFKGKPVVLNFWASWCPPCRSEMPDYEKVYRQYGGRGVVFMMVNLTDGDRETAAAAKRFLQKNGYTFPAYFDMGLGAANAYGIASIPDSIFIDRNGKIAKAYEGAIDAAAMKQNIEAILK